MKKHKHFLSIKDLKNEHLCPGKFQNLSIIFPALQLYRHILSFFHLQINRFSIVFFGMKNVIYIYYLEMVFCVLQNLMHN